MDHPSDATTPPESAKDVSPAALRRVFAFSLLPLLGVALFAAGGVLGLRAFAHNTSQDCGGGFTGTLAGTCSHYSYWVPIVLGGAGLLVAMCGGAFASYYAARHVGLPLLATLQQRRRSPA